MASGRLRLRSADRQLNARRFQLPPRTTRYEPKSGPFGSVTLPTHNPWRIIAIQVQTPLLHIPVHVVRSKGVRRVTPHRCRPTQVRSVRILYSPGPSNVFAAPPEIRHPRPQIRPVVKRCVRPCTTRIFPLRLRRQSINPSSQPNSPAPPGGSDQD
jgi:hypothetical protein